MLRYKESIPQTAEKKDRRFNQPTEVFTPTADKTSKLYSAREKSNQKEFVSSFNARNSQMGERL
jgi:hypothetical protein